MTNQFSNRYSVPEDENFEPGAEDGVLKNFLEIKSKKLLEAIEEKELQRTELELLEIYSENHCFTADDICNIHELWLGDIYPFAGKYRTVTMTKNGFPFANPSLIPKLMNDFEKKFLSTSTPCHQSEIKELAYTVGTIHIEFILIHPFREGNGRTARLLADLMVMQAQKPPINYTAIDQTQNPQGFLEYINAIHQGVSGNYLAIKEVFNTLINQSI